jgi:hypothetical protein
MTQHYAEPERSVDPYSLPNIETWSDRITELTCSCGVYDIPTSHEAICPSCGADAESIEATERIGWFGWCCLPGCMPDSPMCGPHDTERELLDAMRN